MAEQAQVKVVYPDGRVINLWTIKGKNAREILALAGMEFNGSCGGHGTCGKCKVRIAGDISPLTAHESELLLPEELKRGERIACYCTIKGDVTVWLDYVSNPDIPAGTALNNHLSAGPATVLVKKVFVPGRDKDNPVPLLERLKKSLAPFCLDLTSDNLNCLARLDRANRPTLELYVLVLNGQVKNIERERRHIYGIALDIGTTSLLAALVDLESGSVIGISSQTNMQRVYGENVLLRVSYCLENQDGLKRLQQIVINNVNSMIGDLMAPCQTTGRDIYKVSVTGNPVMLHLFLGLDVSGFASAPYGGIFKSELVQRPEGLGLKINPEGEVLILPQAGGFVGADTIACLLTLQPFISQRYLMIDIGTNGELVLNDRGRMWAASAAAGPAFEGEGITCGVRAGKGAIDRVWINREGLHYHIIGEEPAHGICGSAVVELTAGLLQAGCMDKSGLLRDDSGSKLKFRTSSGESELIVVEEDEAFSGKPVIFRQKDIRQVQLAKAAIRSGIDILLREAGLTFKDLDRIYLAGAFGNYLDSAGAEQIGLLPPVPLQKVVNIGNAAAEGAIMVLTSDEHRNRARQLSENIKCVELANYKDFQAIFMQNINF